MPYFFGSQNLGSLPFGYNPYTRSDVISTGGFWADDNSVLNLNSPLVQSLPITRQLPAFISDSMNTNSGGFYNNLLAQQAGNGYFSGNSDSSMSGLLQMMLTMKQLEHMKNIQGGLNDDSINTHKKEFTSKDIIKAMNRGNDSIGDDDDEESGVGKTYKFDKDNALESLEGFIKNKNKSSVLEYGDDNEFKTGTYLAIKGDNDAVTLNSIKSKLGIDLSKYPRNKREKIDKILKDMVSNQNDVSRNEYGKILSVLGIDGDNTSINKEDFNDKLDDLLGSTKKETDDDDGEKVSKINVSNIKKETKKLISIVNYSESGTELSKEDIAEVKEIIKKISESDSATLSTFLGSLQKQDLYGEDGTKTILGSIFTGMAESDEMSDKEAINTFNSSVLKPLKDAAEEKGLSSEWNAALNTLGDTKNPKKSGTELQKMYSKVDGLFDWFSNDGKNMTKNIKNAYIN